MFAVKLNNMRPPSVSFKLTLISKGYSVTHPVQAQR
jgi:hypothetical protein